MSEFDKELDIELLKAFSFYAKGGHRGPALKLVKQAVDRHVIGVDLKVPNILADSRKRELINFANSLKDIERKSLWGEKQ